MDRIKFSERSRVYIPIYIKPLNDITMKPLRFKVDTGADSTTVSKIWLHKLGFDAGWIAENVVVDKSNVLSTASGEQVKFGVVQLPVINILGLEAKSWPFTILLDEDADFRSNLLGRDLLAGFNFRFNNDEKVLEIERAATFTYIYPKLGGQEIYEVQKNNGLFA